MIGIIVALAVISSVFATAIGILSYQVIQLHKKYDRLSRSITAPRFIRTQDIMQPPVSSGVVYTSAKIHFPNTEEY